MERSQSYTSFETTGTFRQSQQLTNKLAKNNFHHSNSNNNLNNYFNKNKFASTSSLNLRKALELRQTQLQLQQQQQQEQLQRQQWQLLFEQRRKQQRQLQLQQQLQLQHAASIDQLDAPLYLSTLNNFQLMQAHRQKMFHCQKSAIPNNDTDFQHDDDVDVDDDDDDNDNDDVDIDRNADADIDIDNDVDDVGDYSVLLREHVYETIVSNDHNNNNNNNNNNGKENDLTLIANENKQTSDDALSQKLLRFQRQRPHSEAAINYHIVQLSPTSSESSPTTILLASTSTPISTNTSSCERRRLQQCDQALSFDSAFNITTHQHQHHHHHQHQHQNQSNINNNTQNNTITNNNNNNNHSSTSKPNTNEDNMSPLSQRHPNFGKLKRDNSLHSDSSRYSSVDSLLEARKPDPEAILINLGFGPVVSEDILSRIPKRFLKPSQVRGIDTDAFIRRLQLANSLADHSVLGYRGLIGNPDLPPSTIVAKIMERFEVNERKKSMGSIEQTMR